ncbi:hypothetical protein FB565_008192 [Actinoplanes lutulentus]|uniref:SnoaL-like protein n=1 Tax=Actinoplanes lutulentus TaxID=1287878 RepID=A0A327Z837_9ACTN|nr:nuclear transport factor 2 family protein [Actinoplanes lutulentus]MBB2948409.1 hypothetical protein [Actinoplanes lutulentus]RAK34558.1 SnoaL-like protein [Actinoplanes lutulentus]
MLADDRIEIADLHARLAVFLDEGRFEDAGRVYAGDVEVRNPQGATFRGIGTVVENLRRARVDGEHTQRRITDVLVDLAGDEASTSANSLVYAYREGQAPHRTSSMRMAFTVVRTPVGWRFRSVRMTLVWTRADPVAV